MSNLKSSNFNQVLWLGIGQIGNYGITFLSTIILSRYLLKEDYGTFRQIIYIYMTLMAIFTFGFPTVFSYFIPKLTINQQKTLITSLNRVFLFLGASFSVFLYVFSSLIADLLKNPDLSIGLKLFSPFPLFTLPALGVEGIYTALRETKKVAFYQISTRLFMLLCTVLPVVFFKADFKLAIIGWGIASFISFLIAMYMKNKPYSSVHKEPIPDIFKTITGYTFPLLGAFIAGFFINSADQFYISRFYGTEAFADYSNGCISVPIVAIVAMSVKKVLLPVFSKAHTKGEISDAIQIYINAVKKSIILLFPVIIFSIFFSKQIFILIYGTNYSTSDNYFRFYVIRDFLEILPYFTLFLSMGMTRIYFYIHLFGAFFVWFFGYIVVKSGLDASMIVLVRSMFYILSSGYALLYLYQKKNINLLPKLLFYQFLIVLFHSIICAFLTSYIISFINISIILNILIYSVILYSLLIIITGYFIKINYLESFFKLLKK
jgi:O-antigen/teichoic acid export membrane protein